MVSFRLDASYARRLEELASGMGTSVGDAARQAVIRVLEGDDDPTPELVREALQGVGRIEHALKIEARRLSDSVQMLLVNGGKTTADDAREFARRYLLGED